MKIIICLFSLARVFISFHFGLNVLLRTVLPKTVYLFIYLYNFLNVRGKFIYIEQVIYHFVYFSLQHVDLRFIVSHRMFDCMLAGDTEEGTVGSIMIKFR